MQNLAGIVFADRIGHPVDQTGAVRDFQRDFAFGFPGKRFRKIRRVQPQQFEGGTAAEDLAMKFFVRFQLDFGSGQTVGKVGQAFCRKRGRAVLRHNRFQRGFDHGFQIGRGQFEFVSGGFQFDVGQNRQRRLAADDVGGLLQMLQKRCFVNGAFHGSYLLWLG